MVQYCHLTLGTCYLLCKRSLSRGKYAVYQHHFKRTVVHLQEKQSSVIVLLIFFHLEGRAYAVPTTINYTPDSPDLDERRGQPHRSAMVRPRPGGTAYMITVTSAPSKFNDGKSRPLQFFVYTVTCRDKN